MEIRHIAIEHAVPIADLRLPGRWLRPSAGGHPARWPTTYDRRAEHRPLGCPGHRAGVGRARKCPMVTDAATEWAVPINQTYSARDLRRWIPRPAHAGHRQPSAPRSPPRLQTGWPRTTGAGLATIEVWGSSLACLQAEGRLLHRKAARLTQLAGGAVVVSVPVNQMKVIPAPQASVWDTVKSAASHGVTRRLLSPLMVARGGGPVISLVTSAAVRWDMATFGPYAAVKEATRSPTCPGASSASRVKRR